MTAVLITLLLVLLIVAHVLVRRHVKLAITSQPDENGEPHACTTESFSPLVVIQTKTLDLDTGPHELQVFQGIYCSQCGKELCCERCGKTPAFGALLVSYEEGERWTHCCEPPRWAVRYGGQSLAPDDRESVATQANDTERLRWN